MAFAENISQPTTIVQRALQKFSWHAEPVHLDNGNMHLSSQETLTSNELQAVQSWIADNHLSEEMEIGAFQESTIHLPKDKPAQVKVIPELNNSEVKLCAAFVSPELLRRLEEKQLGGKGRF